LKQILVDRRSIPRQETSSKHLLTPCMRRACSRICFTDSVPRRWCSLVSCTHAREYSSVYSRVRGRDSRDRRYQGASRGHDGVTLPLTT